MIKNIKFVITRFVFFKLKMHQNPFSLGRGSAPNPATLPIPLPARCLRRFELGAYGASVLRPPSTQNPDYASAMIAHHVHFFVQVSGRFQ